MPKYNTTFELSVDDIDLIESALRTSQSKSAAAASDSWAVNDLLGRLHNQKVFYRPREGVYVSG